MPDRSQKGCSLVDSISDYTVIDLETTGLNVNTCEIIELSAVRVRSGEVTDTFTSLVKPTQRIPNMITALTGITNEMVKDAPTIDTVINGYFDFLGSDILLGHNIVAYDANILYDLSLRLRGLPLPNDLLDTVRFIRYCNITLHNSQLSTVADHFHIVNEEAHRSLSDCLTNFKCYERLKEHFDKSCATRTQPSSHSVKPRTFSETTQALQTLNGIIIGITCDGVLTADEVFALNKWLAGNIQLSGNYPFDLLFTEIKKALEDGILEQCELENLLIVLQQLLNPVDNLSENCSDTKIDYNGKCICLSGVFCHGEKSMIAKELTELGAIVRDSVTKDVDYLIVGGEGSEAWSCGNYGNKVKKALEMQQKGHKIKILKESEALPNGTDNF